MKNTAIIIPTRLGAKRFPNKPLAKINNVPMIIHVLNRAKESRVGEVLVATPDDEIFRILKENGGRAILTRHDHPSGSDRVYESYVKKLKQNNVDLIINFESLKEEKFDVFVHQLREQYEGIIEDFEIVGVKGKEKFNYLPTNYFS